MSTTDFIHSAVTSGGLVMVNCYMGLSRSATCVLAYLMTKHNMSLTKVKKIYIQILKLLTAGTRYYSCHPSCQTKCRVCEAAGGAADETGWQKLRRGKQGESFVVLYKIFI